MVHIVFLEFICFLNFVLVFHSPCFNFWNKVKQNFKQKQDCGDNLRDNYDEDHCNSKLSVHVIGKAVYFTNDTDKWEQKVLNLHHNVDDVHPDAWVHSKRELNTNWYKAKETKHKGGDDWRHLIPDRYEQSHDKSWNSKDENIH